MVLFRGLGWVLLAMAVGAVVFDALAWWTEGAFRLLVLGDLWARVDPGSLSRAEAGLEHRLSGALWHGVLVPVLQIPVLPAFVLAGLFFLWLGRRSGGRIEPAFLGGGSRPRRRRSRGLT